MPQKNHYGNRSEPSLFQSSENDSYSILDIKKNKSNNNNKILSTSAHTDQENEIKVNINNSKLKKSSSDTTDINEGSSLFMKVQTTKMKQEQSNIYIYRI